ncbi:MAG TPA: TonB-dependent receptor, partial [Acidobacteriota bacterium]|nr:TonB-dependent receptor [Acidobacteriota bacterium]
MRSLSRLSIACLCAFLALFGAATLAPGQAGMSTIRGTVTDSSGAVIPGATVTLTNPATGLTRTQVTMELGTFSFELIPPGTYTIEAENKEFKKRVVSGVQALVGSPTDVKVQLELGNVSETVTVEAGAAAVAVNTQDASLGNNFVTQQIVELPLEARNIQSLLTLQPGVTRDGYVAGARSDQSNVTLDGVDVNEAQTNDLFGTTTGSSGTVLRLNSEAIREFRVATLNPNADLGRSSGAQVNLVTKNGTNAFHGAGFEFYRSVGMTANSFFNNRAVPEVPRTPLLRHTFGGEVDGPIIKNKLFFLYSYEGRRDTTALNVVRVVPLPSLGQGQLKYVDANGTVQTLTTAQLNAIFPAVGISPTAVNVLAGAAQRYPANDFTVGDRINTAGYRFNAPTPVNLNSNILRFDWNVNSKQTAFVRLAQIYDLTGVAAQFPDTPGPNTWSHPGGIAVGHSWTLNPRVVNNFRYGLTHQAFSSLGDSGANAMHFRFIYEPYAYTRTIARTTPVHNFVDDVSWLKGSHTLQFGVNIRMIRNNRVNYAGAYDDETTNPSGYQQGGNVLSDPVSAYLAANNLPLMGTSSVSDTQNAAAALIGRLSNYTANFIFGADGSLLPPGTPSKRDFATEDYDLYFQDAWKFTPNVTLTLGLRYGVSRPVYEMNGLEVRPVLPLGEYFQKRLAGAAAGTPFNDPVTINLSGPANGKPGMYDWDKKGWQPRAAIAWSPNFGSSWMRSLFGSSGKSVVRAGFAILNDYFGESLATFFDNNNTLGFSSSQPIPVNTYNVTTKPPPLFTGYGQDVRSLPKIKVPNSLKFPLSVPVDMGERIESSLDSALQLPRQYTFTLTFERELPKGLFFQASYQGRLGRNLLAQRDPMQLNNLKDPKSGMDWYTAATTLEKIRQTRPPGSTAVPTMPYFDNIFPSNLRDIMVDFYGDNRIPANFTPTQTIFWIARNFYGNDWTDLQADLDLARFGLDQNTLYMQPQYGALATWSTVAYSNYHGMAASLRQRFGSVQWDFNYTFSHSLDNASGLQNAGSYGAGAFIFNSIRPD